MCAVDRFYRCIECRAFTGRINAYVWFFCALNHLNWIVVLCCCLFIIDKKYLLCDSGHPIVYMLCFSNKTVLPCVVNSCMCAKRPVPEC
jgi:hypothetical protein